MNLKIYKYVNILVIMILCTQISWSIRTAYYDYTNVNSGAYEAAKFIKENKYDEEEIYGLGYCSTAIEPYFNSNIFKNKRSNKSYYIWSLSNEDLTNHEIIENLPPIVVYSDFEQRRFENIINVLKEKSYTVYNFDGSTYIKDSVYESQTYHVYVKN